MVELKAKVVTDAWVPASWEEYLQTIDDPAHEKAKGYYYQGNMRVEMAAVGCDHADDHAVILFAVFLFATLKGIAFRSLDNCSFRKVGVQEFQPDVSYYIGGRARLIPRGTNIVDLDLYPVPDLVIEVSKTTLLDDRGNKRTLYEELGISEYWVVDVEKAEILAFQMIDRGSKRIDQSEVLPGLEFAVLEAALRQSRETDQSQVGAWLLTQFQTH
ncbi:Uma2 family endonuclease [Phormidesmis sp. 146-35]